MAALPPASEARETPPVSVPQKPFGRPFLAGLHQALLRRVRGLAWRILDGETEFVALD